MIQNDGAGTAAPNRKHPTTYYATSPNQVWMRDITYLNGPHKGFFYYLYLFSDLYDRSIVGWEVYEEENAEHASKLIRRISLAQGRLTTQPLVLHSDNGSPMKAFQAAVSKRLRICSANGRKISQFLCTFFSRIRKTSLSSCCTIDILCLIA